MGPALPEYQHFDSSCQLEFSWVQGAIFNSSSNVAFSQDKGRFFQKKGHGGTQAALSESRGRYWL